MTSLPRPAQIEFRTARRNADTGPETHTPPAAATRQFLAAAAAAGRPQSHSASPPATTTARVANTPDLENIPTHPLPLQVPGLPFDRPRAA